MCLYELVFKVLTEMELVENEDSDLDSDDLRLNLKTLLNELFGKLDPSLRSKVQKRGITIQQNIYTGFDTEYKNVDSKTNKLLSVQLAVSTRTQLKVPLYEDYRLMSLDSLTGQEYLILKPNTKDSKGKSSFNFDLVERSLNLSIKEIRSIKYKTNDASISVIQEGLKSLGIPNMVKDGFMYFTFPQSLTEPYIFYDNGEGYSLTDLIKQTNKMAEPYISIDYQRLIKLLTEVSKQVSLHFD